jgi:hypothetical protein
MSCECVILVRHPNDKVTALMEDDLEHIAVFPDLDAAVDLASEHILCQARPYQIVELDEL